jgi:hypothetical protein
VLFTILDMGFESFFTDVDTVWCVWCHCYTDPIPHVVWSRRVAHPGHYAVTPLGKPRVHLRLSP